MSAFHAQGSADCRLIVNVILYVNRTECAWRYLPKDFPPWRTVYGYFTAGATTASCGRSTISYAPRSAPPAEITPRRSATASVTSPPASMIAIERAEQLAIDEARGK